MRAKGQKKWAYRIVLGVLSLVMAVLIGVSADSLSIVSRAQSQAKVTASSAKIRKEPSASSQALGSAQKDDKLTINHQTKGSDGNTWYQVFVDADTLGYIRSDLVSITDGSTPQTVEYNGSTTNNTPTNTPAPAVNETPVEVSAVEPVSGTVAGSENVRVRSNASTTSQIVTTAQRGLALTVTGTATGSDDKQWYQVEFISNGTSVVGFIRSDYVELSGELTAPSTGTEPEVQQPEEPAEEEPTVDTSKDWETQLQGEKWYLLNLVASEQYAIEDLFNAVTTNQEAYKEVQKTVKSQKIAIVILVILLIGVAAIAAFLAYKIKDMMDSAYYSQVEKETLRRQEANRSKGGQNVMHTVGNDRKPQGARPQGARPQGAAPQGARPQGARPQGAAPQGAAPQGARPQGARPQGARPQGAAPQGARPQGARPQGAAPQGARPQGARPQGAAPQGARPQGGNPAGAQQQGWKSKNFMAEDDEFEFEFLNWDGEEE